MVRHGKGGASEEIDLLVAGYLDEAGGNALLALRHAATDVLRATIDLRLAEIGRIRSDARPSLFDEDVDTSARNAQCAA